MKLIDKGGNIFKDFYWISSLKSKTAQEVETVKRSDSSIQIQISIHPLRWEMGQLVNLLDML